MRSYAIGDIHGQLALLEAAHARIAADRAATGDTDTPVIHIGDLVDRGPDSAGVVDLLAKGIAAGEPWIVLKGNHDRMFSGFLGDARFQDPCLRPDYTWLHARLGGQETLASYGVEDPGGRPVAQVHADALARIPPAHRDFLAGLPVRHRRGDAFFVHAGIRPGVALEKQTEDDMTWIRGAFLEDLHDHGPLIVHGHTPVEVPSNYGNRLNIDTGAAYGGPLTAVVIEGRDVWELTESGRVRLPPY